MILGWSQPATGSPTSSSTWKLSARNTAWTFSLYWLSSKKQYMLGELKCSWAGPGKIHLPYQIPNCLHINKMQQWLRARIRILREWETLGKKCIAMSCKHTCININMQNCRPSGVFVLQGSGCKSWFCFLGVWLWNVNAFFICKMEISGLPISADGYENQMRECVWTHKHLLVANNHILPMECYFLNPVSF